MPRNKFATLQYCVAHRLRGTHVACKAVSPKFLRCKQGGGSKHHPKKTIRSTPVARYAIRPLPCFPIARIHALPPPPPSFPHMCLCASASLPLSTPSAAASVWPGTTPEDRSKSRRRRRRRGGSALAPPVRPTTPSLVSRRVHGSVGRANQLLTTVLTYPHCTLASTLPTFTNKQQDRRKSVRSRNWA